MLLAVTVVGWAGMKILQEEQEGMKQVAWAATAEAWENLEEKWAADLEAQEAEWESPPVVAPVSSLTQRQIKPLELQRCQPPNERNWRTENVYFERR